jgi:hypothetical protein
MANAGNAEHNSEATTNQAVDIPPQQNGTAAASQQKITEDYDQRIEKNRERFIYRPLRILIWRPLRRLMHCLDTHDGLVTAAATVAIAWLTFFLSIDSSRQAETARDQFRIMQGQLNEMQAEQRPWVYPTVQIKGRIQREGPNFVIPLTWTLTNVGHLPALSTTINVSGVVVSLPFNMKSIPNDACDKLARTDWGSIGGGTVFPNQTTEPQGHSPRVSQVDFKNLFDGGKDPMIVAAGCVDYRIPGTNDHHQTQFAYVFGQSQPLGVVMMPADPTSVDIGVMGSNNAAVGTAN